jgi:radical SAM superfamily enzyme YgiQ (UPF0313 family)
MKLLLINPFDKNTCAFSRHFPPLSLGYIAALTPPEWDIELVDEHFEKLSFPRADLVAVTAMTIQINRVYEICRVYQKSGIPVVVGGIHPSMLPDEASNYAASVIVGEAESLWPNLIDDFENGKLKKIYRSNSYPCLQNMVIPRRDLFSNKYLFDCIQTSRGCPFNCDFCSVSIFNGREYRLRPVEEVLAELKTIKKKYIFFVDDNIVGHGRQNEERAVALFEGMLKHKIRKHWISQASVNVADNEKLLKLMKKTGCLGLLIGFESINSEHLKECGKIQNLTRTEVPEATYNHVIDKMHKAGIAVNGYFCYGYEDTGESIMESLQFILKSGIDIVNTPIVIPSPGTTLYEKMVSLLEFKNYPQDWGQYLGRLVYSPQKISKNQFYKTYIYSAQKLNSTGMILKRAWHSFCWSKSPFQALMILLFNLGYRRLRQKGMKCLLERDADFKMAYDELKQGHSSEIGTL